jgi:hypothetical protein
MIMRKNMLLCSAFLVIALILLAGCQQPEDEGTINPLFNQSMNEQLENLTVPGAEAFVEFFFNYTPRVEAKYEIAEDDVFMLSMGNFTSTEISFLGVMLGDSYEDVLGRLGIPDVLFIPADESYKNMEYRKKIGIGDKISGISFHLENDTVTRITVKSPFKKYMHGNTSIGTDKEIIYYLLDVPDYQDFVSVLRVFHYVEKGVDVYFKNRYVDRISFSLPKDFKGVEYVTVNKLVNEGIFVNITEPVLIE